MGMLLASLGHRTWRHVGLDVVAICLALLAGVLAFSLVARGTVTVGPARLAVSVAPALKPVTVVEVPPFGSVEARTHRGPARLTVRLDELDIVRTSKLIGIGSLSIPKTISPDVTSRMVVAELGSALRRFVGLGLAACALVAAAVALALRRGRAVVIAATVLALAIPGIALGTAYATWNAAAFRAPTLHGSLVHAPQLMDVISSRVEKIQRLRDEAGRLAGDISAYYADDRSIASGGSLADTFRVLHVTDLHLDPVGAELAKAVAKSYEASLVIDTGDLAVYGAEIESSAFSSLIDTSVPRVFVPGNHESVATIDGLKRIGVTVLSSGTIEVDGLRIFGVADPMSRDFGVEFDTERVKQAAAEASDLLKASMASGEPTPDIVAIHNPHMEGPYVGLVPLILSGHTHAARFYISHGTARLNSGTLGGMPYDPKKSGREVVPYSLSVLYYTSDLPRRLIAIDRIAVYPNRSTTVTREVVDDKLLP